MTIKITADRNILLAPRPTVGTPATVHYYSDSHAAVVVKVSPKSIVLARVETGPSRPDTACDSANGVLPHISEGILSKIIPGSETRYTFRRGAWRNGSISASLGRSVTWVDYRD